jgi:DNA-binding response OmpR family regulator
MLRAYSLHGRKSRPKECNISTRLASPRGALLAGPGNMTARTSRGGFATDILSSGEEALTLFRGRLKNYKALVTDVGLKGRLNGWEVAAQIRETDPAFPVVYMSGAHADDWASKGVPNSIMLAKPFAPAQLVTAISQLLNSVPPTTT